MHKKLLHIFGVKLPNGQVLTEGNPKDTNANIKYVKAMGYGQVIDNASKKRNAIEKQLLIEIDSELIQGAQLEVKYEVTFTNNNEIDYDYGNEEDYTDISGNNYITKSPMANYYYYGEYEGLNPMSASIEFVDYLDSEYAYKKDTNTNWADPENITEFLKNKNLSVSNDVEEFINKNSYKVLQSDNDGKLTLGIGETSPAFNMEVSKLLTNQAENVFDNGVEIIKIDGKTARTIQESKGGEQIPKSYVPGNYVPSKAGLEQDEDRAKVIITPPTGTTNYITTYVIAGLVGLITIVVGIAFIKKKVLTK